MFDTHSADSVEIIIRDGKVWVNVEGVCQFRAYRIKEIDLKDEREPSSVVMRPFDEHSRLSGGDVVRLHDWLEQHVEKNMKLTNNYTIGDLVSDLGEIDAGMWNDGIDAMGEDA